MYTLHPDAKLDVVAKSVIIVNIYKAFVSGKRPRPVFLVGQPKPPSQERIQPQVLSPVIRFTQY